MTDSYNARNELLLNIIHINKNQYNDILDFINHILKSNVKFKSLTDIKNINIKNFDDNKILTYLTTNNNKFNHIVIPKQTTNLLNNVLKQMVSKINYKCIKRKINHDYVITIKLS